LSRDISAVSDTQKNELYPTTPKLSDPSTNSFQI
jgi:hypothetical protein